MMEVDEERPMLRPRTLDTEEYVKARVDQIAELLDVIDNPALGLGEVTSGPRTVFQRLPRHMRRRAMSHNVKRLPRALRPIAARHTAKTLHRKKAPSRKWRRRPSRLLKRWIRIQKRSIWLETHIWHAKRFHMQDLWGYKLAMRSCQRGFRPNYRCSVRSAVILDQSYLCCLQFMVMAPMSLELKNKLLIDALSPFCQKQVSPTFSNPLAISAHFEVSLMLFAPGKYPHGFLGPARISWTAEGLLNLWIHPTMESQMLKELRKLSTIGFVPPDQMKRHLEGSMEKEETESEKPIRMSNLRNRLCRFRLIGSKSLSYLHNALKLVSDDELSSSDEFAKFRSNHNWLRNLAPNVLPGNLKDGQVVSLLVEDPRLFRARPLQHLQQSSAFSNPISSFSSHPTETSADSTSLFWDLPSYHQHLLPKRLSHAEFERFCAGKLAFPRRTEFKIPILLVFRRSSSASIPNNLNGTAVNCVDLICPGGVGYDFWLALQFANCRAIGIRDKCALDFESGLTTFPDDCPDCSAGKTHAQTETQQLLEKHKRKPRNRRIEFARALRVKSPFAFEWEKLVADYQDRDEDEEGFFVLRDRQMLKRLQLWFRNDSSINIDELITSSPSALVPVSLKMMHRGVPKRLALICLPTKNDLELMRSEGDRVIIRETEDGKSQEEEEVSNGEEQNGEDPEQKKAKKSAAHLPEFISLLDKNNDSGGGSSYFPVDSISRIGELVSLNELFPDKGGQEDKDQRRRARNVKKRQQKREKKKRKRRKEQEEGKMEEKEESEEEGPGVEPTRKLIGRVVRGDYAFTSAQGIAFGYIPLGALKAIGRERIVLVRNTTSVYYHPAKIAIYNALQDF